MIGLNMRRILPWLVLFSLIVAIAFNYWLEDISNRKRAEASYFLAWDLLNPAIVLNSETRAQLGIPLALRTKTDAAVHYALRAQEIDSDFETAVKSLIGYIYMEEDCGLAKAYFNQALVMGMPSDSLEEDLAVLADRDCETPGQEGPL